MSFLHPHSDILTEIFKFIHNVDIIRYFQIILNNNFQIILNNNPQNIYDNLISNMEFHIDIDFSFDDIKYLGTMTKIRKLTSNVFKNNMTQII